MKLRLIPHEGDAWDVRVRKALMTCVGGAIQAEEKARQRNLAGKKKKKKKKKKGRPQGPGCGTLTLTLTRRHGLLRTNCAYLYPDLHPDPPL